MGPKKGKDVTADENYWRTSIEDAILDEPMWKVKVIIIETAGSDQDRIYMNRFETFAAEEKRFVIKNICKTETIFMINQLGGEKKVKDDNLRVFEEGQAYLKDKRDIPPDMLALVIKHLILKMKEEYLFIRRQRLEVREGMRRESTTMIDRAEVRGTVSVKPPEITEPSPPPKAKGKKGEPEPVSLTPEPSEGKKYNTALRVRGEEWRDKVYVDDFPTDGPNLYVTITGFVDPYLPASLIKIGIPLTAVVQVRIDCVTTEVPSSLLRSTKRGQSQTELLTVKSLKFWDDLQQLRIHRDTADTFKDTAFVIFTPPYWDSESLSGDPDKIYDELCFLMYDIQDLTRQHHHYLENMNIIHVPEDERETKWYKYYNQVIQDLPLECVTIYSLLNSILQSVEKAEELEEKSSRTSLSTAVVLNTNPNNVDEDNKVAKAEQLVQDVFNTLCKTDTNRKSYRITYGDEYEQHKAPIVIHYGDIAKYTTFHLGNINLDNIVWTTLYGMPINSLWQGQKKPSGELEAKINFHVNVLLSCFNREDVETAELNRLIHILACRKLYNNRSSLKKKHLQSSTITEFKKVYLKRSILAEPLPQCPSVIKSSSSMSPSYPSLNKSENVSNTSYGDDPEINRIKFLFDCPDLSELVSAAEIAIDKPINHIIDDFEYFEDFSGVSAFQILFDVFNKFNCVDYKYCEVTDSFVLMFFNSHNKDGIAREEWRCHIPTPLCLQDFFDFVLEEHYDWIQAEEKIYEGNITIKSQSVCKETSNPFAEMSCVETMEVGLDLLMEGSLKYQELVQLEEEVSPETATTTKSTSKKTTISPSSTEVESKSKKTKSTPSTPRTARKSFMATGLATDSSENIPRKPFTGYDLGNRRVEVIGQNSTFFSKDGTKVFSKYTLTIPMNLEYIILNVVPGNGVNEFWLHRALGEYVTPEITDMCESFRITSKNQVLIYIKKQTFQIPIPLASVSFNEPLKNKEPINKTTPMEESENLQLFENKYFHSLLVTWPNGCITESVHLYNSPDISHIKQFYINPLQHLDEEMRCVSLKGEVIIFKPSGIIEALQPDGSVIKITKCEKRIVITEPIEELHSETSSDKSKKGKGKEKEKVKEKPSKASSKSSKNAIFDDLSDLKPPEYELVIEEFETIETNGLRQKWINEAPFPIEKLLIRTATDYCLREVFSRRMDGTNVLINKDGVQVVTFPNNTRIITTYYIEDNEIYPEWTEDEKEYFDMIEYDTIDTETLKSRASMSQKSYAGTNPFSTSAASSFSKKIEEEQMKEIIRNDGYISVQIIVTVEHERFPTITVNRSNDEISVESPNKTKIVVDVNNHYDITLDQATTAKFDGQTLNIAYEACSECCSNTLSTIKVKSDDMSSVTKMHQTWLNMKDSFCNKIVVNEEGHISTVDEPCSTEIFHTEDVCTEDKRTDAKSETSITSHGKCREMYLAKTMRFFVLQRDLSCSELVHQALLDQYKKTCRWQPWCSINEYDTFGDYRSLLSILTPVNLNESELLNFPLLDSGGYALHTNTEYQALGYKPPHWLVRDARMNHGRTQDNKWLMDSKLADKPKYLTYKDLRKDCGKGFYHWMRPYDRFQPKPMKPDNVLPPKLPGAFILRTLEQQWKPSKRQTLKGAKELLAAILLYRRIMESDSETILHVPIRDLRTDSERRTDDIIQALGHRIYEDLKMRLAEDIESRARANITTRPVRVSSETIGIELEGELEEEEFNEQKALEEEREGLVKEVEAAEEMSPNLKRYWRRRAEEFKEEQFYKYLLRDGSVPPYFRNVLGGAIWWEINNTADEAATKAARRKMKCHCAEEGSSRTDDTVPPFL